MKKIDVLDFDGTLYEKDSSKEIFKYCLKKNKKIILSLRVWTCQRDAFIIIKVFCSFYGRKRSKGNRRL